MSGTVFTTGEGDGFRQRAEHICIENGCRLEVDNYVYNAFGIRVARYLGVDAYGGLKFENLKLESDWDKMKITGRG